MITPAYESFVNDICYDIAEEGANININSIFDKYFKSAIGSLRVAKNLMASEEYNSAIEKIKEAKSFLNKGASEIRAEKDGPLSATIIAKMASNSIAPMKIFKAMSEMKEIGVDYKGLDLDWIASTRIAKRYSLIATAADSGSKLGRRIENWKADKERGEKFKWTFNSFKQDLMYTCNAYIKACDKMIAACQQAQREKDEQTNED